MVSNDMAAIASDIADPDMQKFLHEGILYNSEDDGLLQNALKVSSEVDMTLAYSSEKLSNLENLLLHVLAAENDVEASDFENDNISEEIIQKAFKFDLLYAILNFELRELDNLMVDLQDLIVDGLHKISSYEHSTDLLTGLARKLHESEDVLKQSQECILEMKIRLAKLRMTSFIFKQNEQKPEIRTVEDRRILRMLEISLARELKLEKKLVEVKQNEEDLKSKISLIEQVAGFMEEAAEVAWSRFLEADNAAEVLMGISKEMLGKLQIIQFNLSSSTKREEELKSKLQDCVNQLSERETSIQKFNSSITWLMTDNAEVTGLRERVQMLEEKLSETESQLMEANASSKTSRQKLEEMEGEIEALRENLYAAESRAGSVEEKVTHLTESNTELMEELDFLKGSNDSNAKKVSLLEKQLRELENHLQHSRASSESSQEQQNMLYSAIWDMETLIDELRQKVAKAESNTESAEDRCIMLSETNSELNKELDFLRTRMEFMETSLEEATLEKRSNAKDISIKTSLIMDMVMQLTAERERIQKELISLTKENTLLREKLLKERNNASKIAKDNRSNDDRDLLPSRLDSAESQSAKTSAVKTTQASSGSSKVETLPMDASPDENGAESSIPAKHSTTLDVKLEAESLVETGKSQRTYMFMATLVLLLSILAAHLFYKKLAVLKPVES